MKAITRFLTIFCCLAIYACNDKFLDLKPIDKLYDGNFWRTPADLALYCNSFYGPDMFNYIIAWNALPIVIDEMSDDIIASADGSGQTTIAAGLRIVPGSGGLWSAKKSVANINSDDWSDIRACNVFLKQYTTAKGDQALINHYAGVIRFFRAMDYFKKVSHFGDVPWIGQPLNINSEELITQKRDPRALVMDSVLEDLNFAAANCLPPASQPRGAVNVDVVNAYKSRICLFEGTFMKSRNLGGYEKFLQAAVEASGKVMQSKRYQIWKGTGDPKRNYRELFWQKDIYATKECIMGQEYYPAKGSFNTQTADMPNGGGTEGMSMWFVRSYLNADGTPFAANMTQTWIEEVTARDGRLAQTLTTPGYIWFVGQAASYGDTVEIASIMGSRNPTRGINRNYGVNTGYQLTKWCMNTLDQQTVGNGDNGYMLMRYAEVLLNFAEATAELGTLSQTDLDKSINLLRDRIGMVPMSITPVHDPNSDWIIAGISPLPPDLIIEIRRERRVELAGEGIRRNDLMRWKAGKLLELPAIGVKYVASDYKENKYPALALKPDVSVFYDENMRIWPWKKTVPKRVFDEAKDYLWPIPSDVINKSNGGIAQNPGW